MLVMQTINFIHANYLFYSYMTLFVNFSECKLFYSYMTCVDDQF